jgi:hypothetical protein
MEDIQRAMDAVGSAAQAAGKLGEQAYSMMSNSRVTSGIKNAASKAYETAKQLKNSVPIGSLGTKALNAARSFKNTVSRSVNPQTIANSASKAASFIGQAAQGAGSKMAQVGSTIKNTFSRYGGLTGLKNRAFAPTNVGNRTNPFRMPVPGWYAAATGQMPQKSIFMPNTPASNRTGLEGVLNRALAPTNVGDPTNPFRTPKPALLAAMQGQTPQKSIASGWWGRGGLEKRNRTLRKKLRKGTRKGTSRR